MNKPCPEQEKLSRDAVNAVEGVYAAKAEDDKAKKSGLDTGSTSANLVEAWRVERAAVKALDDHKRQHGCK